MFLLDKETDHDKEPQKKVSKVSWGIWQVERTCKYGDTLHSGFGTALCSQL